MVVNGFLGNKKEGNYRELISDLLVAYKEMGSQMTPKLHMPHLLLAFFMSNMGAYLEEHGERFQQDVLVFKKSYQGGTMRVNAENVSVLSENLNASQ